MTGGLDYDLAMADEVKDVLDKQVELAKTVDAGESEKTPWLLLSEVWIVTAIAVLFILALVLIAYFVA